MRPEDGAQEPAAPAVDLDYYYPSGGYYYPPGEYYYEEPTDDQE
jgi:hypothetical protein